MKRARKPCCPSKVPHTRGSCAAAASLERLVAGGLPTIEEFNTAREKVLSPGQVAARHVRIWRCPGYAVNGNIARCHPDDEPGGYDVGLGLIELNQRPMTLDEANEFAAMVIAQIARAIDYDRRGVTEEYTGQPPPLPWKAEFFDWLPGLCGTEATKILRRMAAATGRLVFARLRAGVARFEVEGESSPNMHTVAWDDVMILERGGYVIREAGSDRVRGARVLTDRGRAEASR